MSPVVIAAFEGWNDAADAASGLVDHLLEQWKAEVIGAIDPEEFYDFQVNRPIIGTDDNGHRRLTWPTTRIAVARPAELDRDVILVRGIEPNMKWRQFCAEVLAACDDLGGRARRHPRRPARRHPAHPADPGDRHRLRARAGRPAADRAVDLRGPDRHRRRLQRRLHPARHPRGVLLGRGPPLRRPAALPQGHARPPGPARGAARGPDAPGRPPRGRQGLGARGRRAGRGGRGHRRLRPRARGDPRHRRPPRGERRGHRPGVRALPQARDED